jgi:hypothetical protein
MAVIIENKNIPSYPSSNGYENVLIEKDGALSWEPLEPRSGTTYDNRTKLQAGAAGDWVNGKYVGATSGAITGTYGSERFSGQDATNGLYYRYEAETDNNWIRTQML